MPLEALAAVFRQAVAAMSSSPNGAMSSSPNGGEALSLNGGEDADAAVAAQLRLVEAGLPDPSLRIVSRTIM